jgi:hypothetical protein
MTTLEGFLTAFGMTAKDWLGHRRLAAAARGGVLFCTGLKFQRASVSGFTRFLPPLNL